MATYLSSYATTEALETALGGYATTQALADVAATIPSLTWPEGKLHEVVNDVGGFKAGDDLAGKSIVDIIETLLCKQPNP